MPVDAHIHPITLKLSEWYREAEGDELPPGDPSDPWTGREFHVKWKRWSYVHCSWDTLSTLSQLGGFKRVTNYIKKADDLAAARA